MLTLELLKAEVWTTLETIDNDPKFGYWALLDHGLTAIIVQRHDGVRFQIWLQELPPLRERRS